MTEKRTKVAEWEKSSYSNVGNDCVEMSRTVALVRDSKAPGAGTVPVNAAFIGAVKRGAFIASPTSG